LKLGKVQYFKGGFREEKNRKPVAKRFPFGRREGNNIRKGEQTPTHSPHAARVNDKRSLDTSSGHLRNPV